jgi:hypothetical protein
MPDIVGDQVKTLKLLNQYQTEITNIIKSGARAILPAQTLGGDLDLSQLQEKYIQTFGDNFGIGIPSKMDATPKEAIQLFFRKSKPKDVHLLRMGVNKQTRPFLYILELESPNTEFTVDATGHRKFVGQNRPITEQRKELLIENTNVDSAACEI